MWPAAADFLHLLAEPPSYSPETAFAAGIDIVSGPELCFYLDELKFPVIL